MIDDIPGDGPYPILKQDIPYPVCDGSARLNTLDIYLPSPIPPPDSSIENVWVIYIHGGAWRDPLITSASFLPTIRQLVSKSSQSGRQPYRIVGYASLNYRLSPYPSHATSPSLADDPARNAQCPSHILDVQSGIRFLQAEWGFGSKYALVGHSCGATIAFQVLMQTWTDGGIPVQLPLAICGVEGIYDLVALLETHKTIPAYREIVEGAFGLEESVYETVSPLTWLKREGLHEKWSQGRAVVIAHSKDDEMVEEDQALSMMTQLTNDGNSRDQRHDEFIWINGNHDEVWQQGTELARVISRALELVFPRPRPTKSF
ncbi:MAG: hypothetical protein M1825_004261 [Sarcosagium campestre]|nr:MAG: hypothetical protein M1825_004261 [Sarcosagium campestre]